MEAELFPCICSWLLKLRWQIQSWQGIPAISEVKGSLGHQTAVLLYHPIHHHPASEPSLGLTVSGTFYSNSHRSRSEEQNEEWMRRVGVSYGSRTWFVSFLPRSTNCLKSSIYPRCCMNSWGRFSLTSERNRCQRIHIIGWLIELVQRALLWQKLESSWLFICHIWSLVIPFSSWWKRHKLSKLLWLPGRSWGLYPLFPPSNAYRFFNSKSGQKLLLVKSKMYLSL